MSKKEVTPGGVIVFGIFYLLCAVMLAWTASLTLGLMHRLLPGDPRTPLFALALFDGGALAWLLVYMFRAHGQAQRWTAAITMGLDLVGVVGVSMAELFLGGQQLAAIPVALGSVVVWGVGIWTALNVIAIYTFHMTDPSRVTADRVRRLADDTTRASLDVAENNIKQEAEAMQAIIARQTRLKVLKELGLPETFDGVQGVPATLPATPPDMAANLPATQAAASVPVTLPATPPSVPVNFPTAG